MGDISPLSPLLPAGGGADLELCPAKISDRFVAYLLDVLPFLAGFALHFFVAAFKLRTAPLDRQILIHMGALWVGLLSLYQFVGNLVGGTVGKKLMGLKVVRRDGTPLGFLRSLVRAAGYLASTPLFNLGFLVALLHPESRALHDLLSGALVVEARVKNPAETLVLFLAAVCAVSAVFLGDIYLTLNQPLPSDLLAVEKAREGLKIFARIEDAYREKNGSYTTSLGDLVEASGDAAEFKKAMLEIFEPNLFRIEAGAAKYRISAAAKDRRQTRVFIVGPLAQPSAPGAP